ncbi:MAG: primosomal protein N' [Ignavibacteria bacterium GWB2_35_12]|nr:MAG: primosomal protein N' [Ignavibacteria bacterium GWA2_35_8]OGU38263.1 MAG: primosomal protein N' [Ignavibacteria bacterium GWB2_35_12]OGU95484.1 MAG: primosomal protein N' [Ignavibacteria bacterium RIFOXYA2_FULL_35_10]OGV20799.1 MAG: primosomal protein N' [Ignavibacteria bacterium RIFOXYC2_FULL_35_21]
MQSIVNIAIPIPGNQLFSYRISHGSDESTLVGRRALVPFGKRTLTGYIVEMCKDNKKEGLKSVYELLDSEPVFSNEMLELTNWIADYYFCSWGIVLKSAIPSGMSPKSVIKVQLVYSPTENELNEIQKKSPKKAALIRFLSGHNDFLTINYLEENLKSGSVAAHLEALEQINWVKINRMIEDDIAPKTQKAVILSQELVDDYDKFKNALIELDKKSIRQSLLLNYINQHFLESHKPVLITDAIKATKSNYQSINSLASKNLIEILEVEVDRSAPIEIKESLSQRDESKLLLNEEQSHALNEIITGYNNSNFNVFLLHGVTGSGKTLVYIHAIRQVITTGKTALILVPEISLTPQLIDRFKSVFHEKIAVLHSRMSEGERYDTWRAIKKGDAKIVIGARSAIFAPLNNIGLVIVDEEHEPSFKQNEPDPKYNARDVALVRGKIVHAVVVLGSATPSIESMYNANTGKYRLLNITQRADGANLPKIEIVNIIESKRKNEVTGILTKTLLQEIEKRVIKKEGVILFQNRRGFAVYLECPECAHIPMCKNCSVTLTYHKAKGQLRCHYCGYTVNASKKCQACSHSPMKEVGFGTQRIEDDLNEWFKEKEIKPVIARMDLDTTSRKDAHRKILQAFSNGQTDILIGTQMVAKGLDFDRVTLVGVVNADLQLYLPDFRASERTFQLLTQVSGRAGRTSEKEGEVIIQSSHPEHPAIQSALNGSYTEFYENEIKARKDALYPPYTRFNVILFSGKNAKKVDECSENFKSLLPHDRKYILALGPVEPVIPKVRNNFRRLIVIKNNKKTDPSGKQLRHIFAEAYDVYNEKYASSSVKVVFDIDSYSGL